MIVLDNVSDVVIDSDRDLDGDFDNVSMIAIVSDRDIV